MLIPSQGLISQVNFLQITHSLSFIFSVQFLMFIIAEDSCMEKHQDLASWIHMRTWKYELEHQQVGDQKCAVSSTEGTKN